MKQLLEVGAIAIIGRHPQASNAVFVVEVSDASRTTRAIYKPVAGERELWDFPEGELARREVAAHVFASALGFDFIPTTVWREDAPHGPGSLQLWIEDASLQDVEVLAEVGEGWLHVLDAELQDGTAVVVAHRDAAELRAVALLDALMNNADRKAGHLFRDPVGALWAVDHGVTFHVEPKLRTVLWGFSGQPIAADLIEALNRVPVVLDRLTGWIAEEEIDAVQARAEALLSRGVFPAPSGDWPAIPWPIW